MMTSEYPSPLTSPAVATEWPNHDESWSLSAVQAGLTASPVGEP